MPTGYTSGIYSGNAVSFNDFALQCARAFGALITMRDDPADAPIPEEFAPSPFYAARVVEDEKNLAAAREWDDATAEREARATYDREVSQWNESRIEREAMRQRYQAMLAQVQAWTPPTADHQGLKDFMSEQLRDSIRCDCDYEPTIPKLLSGEAYRGMTIARLEQSLEYARQHQAEEIQRAETRTQWVRRLRESLKK